MERTRQGWAIPSSAYARVRVCVRAGTRVCVCVTAGQCEGSLVVSGNTPTPALSQPTPAMKAVQGCNPAPRVHPKPQLQHRTGCLSRGSYLFASSVIWGKPEHRLFSPAVAYFT